MRVAAGGGSAMLVTDYFAFVHIPKTGGSFVRRVLTDHLPPDWFLELPPARHQHQGWDELPPAAAGLPVLSFVRNPWAWYVSWYHYHVQLPPDTPRGTFYRTVFDDGANSFAEAVRNACTGNFDHPDGRILETAQRLRIDFYSARVLNILGTGLDDERLTVGHSERLVDDLADFLDRHSVPVREDFRALMLAQPAVNTSRHSSYQSYYDAELRELVASRARLVIERFGFAF
jgi:hypothetical protein